MESKKISTTTTKITDISDIQFAERFRKIGKYLLLGGILIIALISLIFGLINNVDQAESSARLQTSEQGSEQNLTPTGESTTTTKDNDQLQPTAPSTNPQSTDEISEILAVNADLDTTEISSENSVQVIIAEVAQTPKQREVGLMYRENLADNSGMLFVLPEERIASFWMKNTLIPLDIVFIDRDKKIVNIAKNTEPLVTQNTYNSERKVKYVLEINGGKSDQLNYTIGEKLFFSL